MKRTIANTFPIINIAFFALLVIFYFLIFDVQRGLNHEAIIWGLPVVIAFLVVLVSGLFFWTTRVRKWAVFGFCLVASALVYTGIMFFYFLYFKVPPSIPVLTSTSPPHIQNNGDTLLRPDIHFFRLIPDGAKVSPSEADIPVSRPRQSEFTENQSLEVVFFSEPKIQGAVIVSQNTNGNNAAIINRGFYFSVLTGKPHSNLMRPPGVTLWENHVPLGKFKPGVYVLTITIEDRLSQSIGFVVFR